MMKKSIEKLKTSKYILEKEANGRYIYSSKGDKLYRLDENAYKVYAGIKDKKDQEYDLEIINSLIENDIVVPFDMDEKNEYIKGLYDEIKKKDCMEISILPTNDCNFKCVYCLQTMQKGRMEEASLDRITEFIANSLEGYKKLFIHWFGGEPLLEHDVIYSFMQRIKKICRGKKVFVIASITTNGYYLSYDVFKKLKSVGVLNYQITVDGDEYLHNKNRPLRNGKGSYDTIIKNILDIHNIDKSGIFKIAIRFNISNNTVVKIKEYANDWKKHLGDDRRFVFIITPVCDWGGNRIKEIKNTLLSVNSAMKEYDRTLRDAGLFVYSGDDTVTGIQRCYAHNSLNYVLNYNGDIYRCQNAILSDGDIVGENAFLGNVQEGYSKIKDKMLHEIGKTFVVKDEKCEDCFFFPKCMVGRCPLNIWNGKVKCLKDIINIQDKIENAIESGKYKNIGEYINDRK